MTAPLLWLIPPSRLAMEADAKNGWEPADAVKAGSP